MAGNLTRIFNNQITNSTIVASQKIAAGTITGSLFASNVTVPGDFLITGNLFVLGSSQQTTIASTNTYVNDPLIVLNNGFSGTNTYDEGLVFNRGSATNQAFIWSEVFKEFRVIATTETGTTYGNVSASALANLSVGNFFATGVSTLGTVNLGTLTVTGNVIGGLGQFAAINATPIGNATASSGAFTTLSASASMYANSTTASTSTTSGALVVAGGLGIGGTTYSNSHILANTMVGNQNNQGTLAIGQLNYTDTGILASFTTSANSYAQIILQNTNPGSAASVDYVVSSSIGNASVYFGDYGINGGGFAGAGALNLPNNVFLTATGSNLALGTTTANAISFVVNSGTTDAMTLAVSGAVAFNGSYGTAGQYLTSQGTTGAPTWSSAVTNSISNGTSNVAILGPGGAITANVNGTLIETISATSVSINVPLTVTGNIVAGLAQFAALNATPIGNATASTGAFTTLTATGNVVGGLASFASINATPIGNATASTGAFTTLSATGIVSFTNATNSSEGGGTSGALQIAGGASIAKDLWVGGNLYAANIVGVSANVITVQDPLLYLRPQTVYPYNYDIGIYSAFTGVGLGTANIYQHTAVFRDPLTNTWTFASNLAEPSASYITLDGNTIYDPIKAGNLNLVNTTASTNTSTGALIVAGGAGIGGALNAGSLTATGNVIGGLAQFGAINSTPIGNATASTGAFTTLTATGNAIVGLFQAAAINSTPIGNANPAAGTFTTVTAGSVSSGFIGNTGTAFTGASINLTGNVLASTINASTLNIVTENASTINAGALNAVTIGNTGAIHTGLTAQFTGNVIGGLAQFAALNATPIGNATASTGAFTTLTATGNVIGGLGQFAAINSTPIGNASASTGAFTTLSASGAVTASTSAVFNNAQGANTFTIKGISDPALFVATPGASGLDGVVIGGQGNTTPTYGAGLKVGGTGAIQIPFGSSAQRPGSSGNVDLVGMVRYNTTTNNLEFCTVAGSPGTYTPAGSTFTTISDRQFSGNTGGGYGNVDGTNTSFTLSASSTTAGTLVAINGVIQFPTLAYSVSGATLTFTEPPAPGDVIDARVITTTSTVSTLASATGNQAFNATDGQGLTFQTGSNSSSSTQATIDTNGNFNLVNGGFQSYDQPTPVNIPSTGVATRIFSFPQTAYTSAFLQIQAKVGTTRMEAYKSDVVTDGAGNAYISTFGVVNNGTSFGSISANVVGSNVQIYITSTVAQANVKVFGTLIV